MQKRDFETYQKRFRDFEILPKFSETHVFRGTIRHPYLDSAKFIGIWSNAVILLDVSIFLEGEGQRWELKLGYEGKHHEVKNYWYWQTSMSDSHYS